MHTSTHIAQIIALILIADGIGTFTAKAHYQKVFEGFEKSPSLSYLNGLLSLIGGALIVQYSSHWIFDWTIFITIFGWFEVLKGVIMLAFPTHMDILRPVFQPPRYFGVFALSLGVVFAFFGFFC